MVLSTKPGDIEVWGWQGVYYDYAPALPLIISTQNGGAFWQEVIEMNFGLVVVREQDGALAWWTLHTGEGWGEALYLCEGIESPYPLEIPYRKIPVYLVVKSAETAAGVARRDSGEK